MMTTTNTAAAATYLTIANLDGSDRMTVGPVPAEQSLESLVKEIAGGYWSTGSRVLAWTHVATDDVAAQDAEQPFVVDGFIV